MLENKQREDKIMIMNLNLIRQAQKTLEGNIYLTPVFTAKKMKDNFYIKMENLQETGSFKIRGAFNKIANLTEEEGSKGVITASAGNHAQGVALSASQQGIKSYICIPSVAPLAKIEATRNLGGEVIIVDGTFDEAQERAYEIQKEKGYTYVHPFDDPYVIAGQGTIGLEIIDQVPNVKQVLVPIGGGGLIAGVALALKSIKPEIRVIGVEAENAASAYQSRKAGHRICLDSSNTIADGIAVKCIGQLNYELIEEYVDDIVTVSEEEIQNAILRLLEDSKVAAEGAGSTAVAAVMSGKVDTDIETCAILSGGNINMNIISKVIQDGLFNTGRLAEYTIRLEDKPGELIKFLNFLYEAGANIVIIDQYRDNSIRGIDYAMVRVVVETFNENHRNKLTQTLEDAGYKHLEYRQEGLVCK